MNTESEYYLHSNLNRRKWEKPTPTWTKKRFLRRTECFCRYVIAPPHPTKAITLPHPKKRSHIPKQRSPSHPKKRSHLPHTLNSDRPLTFPKAIAHPPTSSKSELLAAALRYRPSHPQKAIALS
ncbi:hypothetical protein [Anabaena sp. UHCC 0451]|uniref:hypothetical protein n=1 Tax=Anabaena sp. UHCC 0451 TaxID=2055235 RepID=UPI002B1EAD4C|nr:hypothetical protein [Anabaena sp. UHCC 0451]MEA5574809.1 hypothetical protein [Anabaena sp. UHCC 0451]